MVEGAIETQRLPVHRLERIGEARGCGVELRVEVAKQRVVGGHCRARGDAKKTHQSQEAPAKIPCHGATRERGSDPIRPSGGAKPEVPEVRAAGRSVSLASTVVLADRKHWIFDLDGTLTKPVHDFDEIRRMLGVPNGRGILEWLAQLSEQERAPLVEILDRHEYELAERAEQADGAAALLAAPHARGVPARHRHAQQRAQRRRHAPRGRASTAYFTPSRS